MFSRSIPGRLARRGITGAIGFVLRRIILTRAAALVALVFIGIQLWLSLLFGDQPTETVLGSRISVFILHLSWTIALILFSGGRTIFNRAQVLPIGKRILHRIRRVPFLWQTSVALIVISLLLSLIADITAFAPVRVLSAPVLALACLDALALVAALQVARERRTQLRWRPALSTLLSVTEQVIRSDGTWVVDSQASAVARTIRKVLRRSDSAPRTLTISDPPSRALTAFTLEKVKWRIHATTILGPGWVGEVDSDAGGPAVLLLREASLDEIDHNRALVATEGAVIEVRPIYETGDREDPGMPSEGEFPSGYLLQLAPKSSASQLERINAWTQDEYSAEVVLYEPERRRALVRRLDDVTRDIRALTAEIRGEVPWSIDLSAVKEETGEMKVTVSRYNRRRDTSLAERLETWRAISSQYAQYTPEWLWKVEWTDSQEIEMRRYRDPLLKPIKMEDFEQRVPDRMAYTSYPVAVTEDGDLHFAPMFHVLVVGATGSGKGSVIWSTLRPYMELGLHGLAKIYGLDPKAAETVRNDGTARGCFEEVATTPDAWTGSIGHVKAELEKRKERGGRTHAVTTDEPILVLFIDELSAVTMFDSDSKRAKVNMDRLLEIATQGRSLNIWIVAAVQQPLQAMIGPIREFIDLRYALRTKKRSYTDMILGEGATALGAVAHELEPATPANGYRTAGIGWALPENDALPKRIRFPYISDEWLDAWDDRYFEKFPERRNRRPARDASNIARLDAFKVDQDSVPDVKPTFETPLNLDPDKIARFRAMNDGPDADLSADDEPDEDA